MSIFRKYNSLLAVAGLSLVALTACDDSDGIHFTPGQPSGNTEVYIPSTAKTYFELAEDQTSVTLTIYRSDDTQAVTVGVDVSPIGDNLVLSAFSLPSSVTFKAGEKTADYIIGYDATKLEYDQEAVFYIKLEDQYTSPYGASEAIITLVLPGPWTELGVGKVGDTFWGVDGDDTTGEAMIDVKFYQNDLNPNRFRIDNMYYDWNGEDTYFEFTLLKPGDVVQGVTITLDNLVYFPVFYAEYVESWGGDVYIFWPGDMADLGYPLFPSESDWVYNYVVAYQDNGLPGEIHLSPVYIEPISTTWGGSDTASGESITLLFPGFEQLDLTTEVTYEGMLTDATNALSVIADVVIGADIESAKVGVAAGTDISSIASAIQDGSLPSTEVTSSTQVKISFDDANAPGKYSVVVVGYKDGNATTTASTTFNWQGLTPADPNEGWNSLGYVKYTDGYVCSTYLVPNGTSYYVEIQESSKVPGYFRLVDPYGAAYPYNEPGDYDPYTSSYLMINAVDPDFMYVEYSVQSLDWGRGELECESYADMFINDQGYPAATVKAAGYGGYYEDGVMYFPNYPLDANGSLSNTELLMGWGGQHWYYANYEIDYELYATQGVQDFVYAANGYLLAPWEVDMNASTNSAAVAARDNARIKKLASRISFRDYDRVAKASVKTADNATRQIKNINKMNLKDGKNHPMSIEQKNAIRTLKRRY